MATVDTFLPDFIQTTFFSGYTVFNTIVYSLILLLFVILIIKMFKRIDINPESIIFSLVPFILLGSSIRALVDNGIYPKTVFLITPGLYILVGFLTIFSLLLSLFLYRKLNLDYRYALFSLGIVFAIPNLILFPKLNLMAMSYVILTWILSIAVFLALFKIVLFAIDKTNFSNADRKNYWKKFRDDKTNLSIVFVHLFDASTTFIAVEYFNYYEQHVLANALNQLFDTSFSMYPMKLIVILSVLYIIDQYIDDLTIKNLLKLTVFVLGLAPGLRNFLTLAIGV